MNPLSRRKMLGTVAAATVTAALPFAAAGAAMKRRFTIDLSPGAVGVSASQEQAIDYAAEYGFESVYANAGYLAGLDDTGREKLAAKMKQKDVVFGAAGLPVDFRRDEATFQAGLKELPRLAKGMQLAGVTRVGTWLSPYHHDLTYVSNFRQHARRLRECCKILGDHGQRFGMEYVGPKTLWASKRHSFIHSMAETKELIAEIGLDNVGFVLDSWHWYTAHETVEDLLTLKNEDVIACDLNDAPKGLPIDEQIDNRRELPTATGVIDLKAFLAALVEIDYDGPIRAEPFNAKLNAMDNDAACEATGKAMHRAFDLVGG